MSVPFLKRSIQLRDYPEVKDTEWVSQYNAASELDITMFRLSFVIANDHLDTVENSDKEQGVSRESLNAEKEWRRNASIFKKLLRLLVDIINWV